MVRGLAIETSGRAGELAIAEDGRVVAVREVSHGLKHAAGIVAAIDGLCAGRGWGPGDIDEIYVSAGPGSFTGLRVGVTVAKTLAFATGARVVAVPTVEVLAWNAPAGWENLIIVLDAKRGQIFTASFENQGGVPVLRAETQLSSLEAMLRTTARPVHLLGEGLPYHADGGVGSTGMEGIVRTKPEQWAGRAAVVAELGAAMARVGKFTDPAHLTPIYIRRPEAEEKYEERNAGR